MTPPLRRGVAIGQRQVEGPAEGSDWHRWERDGLLARSSPNDFTARFAEHFAHLAESDIEVCRFTVDWARVMPRAGRPDREALEHVQAVVAAAASSGVAVWAGLHETSLPGWFVDEGGFADDRARGRLWPAYVDLLADTIGDRVAGWFPLVSPLGYARRGYLAGDRPPGLHDPETHARVVRGLWLAWRDAWRVLRGGPPVATALDLAPVYRADLTVPAQQAARDVDDGTFGVAISAFRDGLLTIPGRAEEEVVDLQNSADTVGITYAGGLSVAGDGKLSPYPPGSPQPWPEGLGLVVRRLAEQLPGRRFALAGLEVAKAGRDEAITGAAATLAEAAADGVDLSMLVVDAGADYPDLVWPGA